MSVVLQPPDGAPAAVVAGNLTLHLLDDAGAPRWDAFVEQCDQATFFHRAGWQRVLRTAFGHRTWFYYVERGGVIEGVLPLGEVRSRLFGHWLGALPFCVYGGIAASTPQAHAMLDAAAQALAAQLGVGHLEYRNLQPLQAPDPAWISKPLYVTFRKTISDDDEQNLNAIPRKQRAMVRKAIKLGLRGEVDQQVDRFYAAYAHSVHRLGTPVFARAYFALLKQVFGEACEIRVITCDGALVAGVLSFFFRDQVLPYYGGGLDNARQLAGNDFLYWSLLQASAGRGARLFDFGRSKLGTGAFDFKKNWGFQPEPLHYQMRLVTAAALPENNPLNPKFRLFIRAWRHLPLRVANVLGPHIVKYLG